MELSRVDFLQAGVVVEWFEVFSEGIDAILGAPATFPPVFRYCFIQLGVDGVTEGGIDDDPSGLCGRP